MIFIDFPSELINIGFNFELITGFPFCSNNKYKPVFFTDLLFLSKNTKLFSESLIYNPLDTIKGLILLISILSSLFILFFISFFISLLLLSILF